MFIGIDNLALFMAAGAVAAAASQRFSVLQSGMVWLARAAGSLFIVFGLKLALTDNPPL